MLARFNLMSPGIRHLICTLVPFSARFGILRFGLSQMSRHASPPSTPERQILAYLSAQPKAARADAEQTCSATNGGRTVPRRGTGNPELDGAARNAGSLGDRPLIVLTAGQYWAPPGFEKEAAEYHEVWVHQLQAGLARLSTHGRQVIVNAHHDMSEAPEAVPWATRQVVDQVRAQKTF
jgi:hypothetical protein